MLRPRTGGWPSSSSRERSICTRRPSYGSGWPESTRVAPNVWSLDLSQVTLVDSMALGVLLGREEAPRNACWIARPRRLQAGHSADLRDHDARPGLHALRVPRRSASGGRRGECGLDRGMNCEHRVDARDLENSEQAGFEATTANRRPASESAATGAREHAHGRGVEERALREVDHGRVGGHGREGLLQARHRCQVELPGDANAPPLPRAPSRSGRQNRPTCPPSPSLDASRDARRVRSRGRRE